MILGLNTDTRHKGKTFHIQTEDSGVTNPVLFTHVFIGGVILASRRSTYQDALGRPDLEAHVRSLMRRQHQAVHQELVEGGFDDASRPQDRAATGQIPLAKDAIPLAQRQGRRPVGLMGQSTPPAIPGLPIPMPAMPTLDLATASSGATEDIDELSMDDIELIEEPAAAKPRPKRSLQFFTPLLTSAPLDPILLQHLFEEPFDP